MPSHIRLNPERRVSDARVQGLDHLGRKISSQISLSPANDQLHLMRDARADARTLPCTAVPRVIIAIFDQRRNAAANRSKAVP